MNNIQGAPEGVLHSIEDAFVTTDLKGRITWLNAAAERLSGYFAGDLSGNLLETLIQFDHNPNGTPPKSLTDQLLHQAKEILQEGNLSLIKRNSTAIPIAVRINHLKDNDGIVTGLVLSVREYAGCYKLMEELSQSEELYRLTLSNISDAVFLTDTAGEFIFVCPNVHILFGYTEQEVRNMGNISRILGEDIFDPARLEQMIEIPNIERTIKDKNDRSFHVLITVKKTSIRGGTVMYTCHDVTERKLVEEKLISSESILRLFVEYSPAAIAMFDREMRYMVTSRRYITDYRLGDINLEGRSHFEVFPEIDAPRKEIHRRCLAGEIMKNEEGMLPRVDGTTDWVRYEMHPWYDVDGSIGGMIFFSEVITESKLAEAEHKRLAERFKLATQAAQIGIWDWEIQNDQLIWDDQLYALYGLKPGQFGGNRGEWLKGLHPDDRQYAFELTEKAMHGEAENNGEFRVIWPDGSVHWLKTNGRMFRDENGIPVRMTGVNYDITARKMAEVEIRASEEKYRTLTESFDSIITTVDADGIFHYVNQAAARSYNLPADELTGKKMTDIFPLYVAESMLNNIRKVITSHSGMINESVVDVRGDLRWFSTSIQPLFDTSGDVRLALINAVDITYRKNAEEELRKAKDKAEESDRLKSAFLTNMSHEIRTPMNGILGFTELLRMPGLTEGDRSEYINIIKKSGDRMLNTINDLMEISSIEAGFVSIIKSATNINDTLLFMYSFFEWQAQQKGLELNFKTALPDEDAILNTDKDKLESILINLIRNAIKFTNKGSVVFGYEPKASEIEFFVTDTGIGIPAGRLEAVFDRFVQADITLSRKYEGSGLGLSIAKAYVEILGGKVWVRSEENSGSTFYFTIPWITKAIENHEITHAKTTKMDRLLIESKILIAEDEVINYIYLKEILKPFCKSVLWANCGNTAVDMCRADNSIDIVLMDVKMPDINGYDATRQIRAFNKEIIIIAQTAFAIRGEREKAIEAGCNDYIAKPYNVDKICDLIIQHMQ
jgi:PAS domain S-box-containing protein